MKRAHSFKPPGAFLLAMEGRAPWELGAAPPLPTTSIFSRSDGIVSWQCCLQARAALAESIEVSSSHIGIGMDPAAWYAVADRLAQREGKWTPFHRDGWRKWLFRDAYRAGD